MIKIMLKYWPRFNPNKVGSSLQKSRIKRPIASINIASQNINPGLCSFLLIINNIPKINKRFKAA